MNEKGKEGYTVASIRSIKKIDEFRALIETGG